jgi:hypothetical protein
MVFRMGRQVLADLDPLSLECRMGPYDGYSLFAKTLAKIAKDRKESR